MGRPLWFVAGAGAGAYAVLKARRVAESMTVQGMRDRLDGLRLGARMVREEVEQGRVERETELRQRLRVVPDGPPALTTRVDGD